MRPAPAQNNNTVVGWTGWIVVVLATWVFGWVIGEAIPFFGTLLSLMSALFDGFFGCECRSWPLALSPFPLALLLRGRLRFDSIRLPRPVIFWAFAFFELHRGHLWKGQSLLRKFETAFNVFLVLAGLFVFGPGIYTSVQAIIDDYANGAIKGPFTCANNAL